MSKVYLNVHTYMHCASYSEDNVVCGQNILNFTLFTTEYIKIITKYILYIFQNYKIDIKINMMDNEIIYTKSQIFIFASLELEFETFVLCVFLVCFSICLSV